MLKNQEKAETQKAEEMVKIKNKDISLESKTKIIHILVFLIAMYKCKGWTVNKADREK